MNGWVGTILRVDLTTGKITKEDTSKYLDYIGGTGIGYKIIFDEAPMADPFSPESRMVFITGPLTGTLAPASGRMGVTYISPHVYAPKSKHPLVIRSAVGGQFGAELKFAGYDGLIVQGKAAKPVFISIDEDDVSIEDASDIWSQNTFVTQDMIKARLGNGRAQIICTGPSGENLVRIAPLIHRLGNAVGQGGAGAVFGSKNLKAIAVHGKKRVKVAHKDALVKYVQSVREFQPAPLGATPLSKGSLRWTEKHWAADDINHQACRFVQSKTNAPAIHKYHVKNQSCFSCPQGCFDYMYVPEMGAGSVTCVQWFFSWLGNKDKGIFLANQLTNQLAINSFEMIPMIQFIWYLQDETVDGKSLLDLLHEKGLVSNKLKKGLESLHYPPKGQVGEEGLTTLLHMITYRQEFLGDACAEGFCRAMDIIEAELKKLGLNEAAAKVRRFEDMEGIRSGVVGGHGGWGMSTHYDPRTFGYYWAVHYVMDNRDPTRHALTNLLEWTGLSFEETMPIARKHFGEEMAENGLIDLFRPRDVPLNWNGQKSALANAYIAQFINIRGCVKDSLTLCDWVYPIMVSGREERGYMGDISVEYKLYELVTGEKMTQGEMDRRAAKGWNLHRLITAMEWGGGKPVNLRKEHDQLPERFFSPPENHLRPPFPKSQSPHPPLNKEYFEASKTEYYKLMGWDVDTGLPTRSSLKKLGMDDVLASFETRAFRLPD